MSRYLAGMHEAMPPDVMPRGWILFLAEVGHSSDPHPGIDFTPWAAMGYGIICRIQHAWGAGGGCLPAPDNLGGFLQRVASLTRNSQGCKRWIVGNECNVEIEWPNGEPLTPEYVAQVYNDCHAIIDGEVILPPVGPWNVAIGYGWIEYFTRMIDACETVDAFALHTYSRGPSPASIISEDKMDPPYAHLHNGFRTYRDWLAAIPERYRDRAAYITEANQNGAWLDQPNAWIQSAYAEIDKWNRIATNQKIRALILYRWPPYDEGEIKYNIEGKGHVITDFQLAQTHNYMWADEPEPPDPPGDEPMQNPSFELPYAYDLPLDTVKVAHDWTAFWSTGDPPAESSQGPCAMPEYKPASRSLDPRRVVDGATAQCWFLRYKVMDAGVYQVIPVTEGKSYQFDVSLQAWCSNSHDPETSDGEMYATLGIAANGSTNPWDIGVQWTGWFPLNEQHRRLVSREVVAEGSEITLFIRAWNKWRLEHNDVYADDAHLHEIGATDPPDTPDPPGECRALTADQIRVIVREEVRAQLDRTRLGT